MFITIKYNTTRYIFAAHYKLHDADLRTMGWKFTLHTILFNVIHYSYQNILSTA
jgi:hypothetical protein